MYALTDTNTLVTLEPAASGYWDVSTLNTHLVTRKFDTKTDAVAFFRYMIAQLKGKN